MGTSKDDTTVREAEMARYRAALDRVTELCRIHGEANVEVRTAEPGSLWAGYQVVFVRPKADMPWRFSGHGYRELS